MGEFASLEKDMLHVFEEVQRVKEKYGISSITLESNRYTERFHGSHGGKGNFLGGTGTPVRKKSQEAFYTDKVKVQRLQPLDKSYVA